MKKTIARIRPLAPAFAAVVASVFVSLVVLQPPGARLLPGVAPADRGHVGALVLPAPHVARHAVHRQQALPTAAPIPTVVSLPHRQTLQPPAPVHHKASPSAAPKPKQKAKPKAKSNPVTPTPTPTPTPTTPTPTPPPTQPIAAARKGHGPPAHSHSRLLPPKSTSKGLPPGHDKPKPHGPPPGQNKPKPHGLPPGQNKPKPHGPPPGQNKPKPHGPPKAPPQPPAEPAPAPAPPVPPGHGGTPPGHGGTPPGHDKH